MHQLQQMPGKWPFFPPFIEEQLRVLVNERFTVAIEGCCIEEALSSAPGWEIGKNLDRIVLRVLYAGEPLQLTVMFQCSDENCPPDFIFMNGDEFVPSNDVAETWDSSDPYSLRDIIYKIFRQFKIFNESQLTSSIQNEYMDLLQCPDLKLDDIEILVGKEDVSILVKLNLTLSTTLQEEFNRNEAVALLKVVFSSVNDGFEELLIRNIYQLESLGTCVPRREPGCSVKDYKYLVENELSDLLNQIECDEL